MNLRFVFPSAGSFLFLRFRAKVLLTVVAACAVMVPAVVRAQGTAPAVALGNVNVGSSTTGIVTFTFSATTTVASIHVVTQGATGLDFTLNGGSPGTCTATTYAASATCTVGVNFTPAAAGVRYGAANLLDSSGNILASGLLSGTGVAPLPVVSGGTATTISSIFNSPNFHSIDDAGNVYEPSQNHIVYKITPAGTLSTFYNGGSGAYVGTAVDAAGNVYVCDIASRHVYKLNTAGALVAIWPTSGTTLFQPEGMAFDTNGNLYVADAQTNQIVVISPAGVASVLTVTGYTFQSYDIAVDGANTVYISDYGNTRILKVTAAGTASVVTVTGVGVSSPNGIFVDAAGDIYLAEGATPQILRITPAGVGAYVTPLTSPAISYPVSAVLDGHGLMYISDQGTNSLYKVNLLTQAFSTAGTTAVGSTTTEQTLSVLNDGNASATFASVAASGAAAKGPSTTCTTSTPLAVSASCVATIEFAPTTHGASPQTGTVTLSGANFTADTETISGYVTGDPTQIVTTTAPATPIVAGGNGGTVTFTLEDSTGATAVNATTLPVTLTVTGPGSYSHTYGPNNAVNSVATFNTSANPLTRPGAYTYTATSTGLTSAMVSETVNAGPAASLTITPQVTYAVPGGSDNFTINAFDVYGNVAAGTDSITLSSTDPSATYTTNPVALNGGSVTAVVHFMTAGNQTVTATDTTNGSVPPVTSSAVAVGSTGSFIVTSSSDDGTGVCTDQSLPNATRDTNCQLRSAFAGTNSLNVSGAAAAQPTIRFAASLSGSTIQLGSTIFPTGNFNLVGPGSSSLTISPSVSSISLFAATSGALGMTISGVTLSGVVLTANGNQGGAWVANQAGHATTFNNVVFQSNAANGTNSYGAAIAELSGTLHISGCTFLGNHAAFGGGAVFLSSSTTTITNSAFGSAASPNSAGSSGGALYASAGTLSITGSTFTSNTATLNYAGAVLMSAMAATLTNNTFTSNSAGIAGGALYVTASSLGTAGTPATGNIFTSNQVTASTGAAYGGGAIYFTGINVSAVMNSSVFSGNQVSGTYAYGGAIYMTGASAKPNITINNSLFTGNKVTSSTGSAFGGALYQALGTNSFYLSTLTLTGDTFTGNQAKSTGGNSAVGGALYVSNDVTDNFYNDTFTTNSTTGGAGSNGGALFSSATSTTYYPNLYNTIIAANTAASSYPDANSKVTGCGARLCNQTTVTTPVDTGILLSALGSYGGTAIGPTGSTQVPQTILPLPGSPALDANPTCANLNGAMNDARGTGYARMTAYAGSNHCDAGAAEANYTLAFAAEPANTASGATLASASPAVSATPAVQIYESGVPFTYTTPGGTPSLAFSAASGTLSASTATPGTTGVTALNATLTSPPVADDTLTATIQNAAAVTLASATSADFSVTDGSAATLNFIAPPSPSVNNGNNACNTATPASCLITVGLYASGSIMVDTTSAAAVTLNVSGPGYSPAAIMVNASAGIATFDLSSIGLTANGTYTYTASSSYSTDTAIATEIVGTAAATVGSFTVSGIPLAASLFTSYSFTVTANDSNGATLTTYTGPVFLASSDAMSKDSRAAFVPQNYTFSTSDHGVHTFTVTFRTLGMQSVTATTDGNAKGPLTGIDVENNVWLVNKDGTVAKVSAAGAMVTGAVGMATTVSTFGGVAVDNSGNVWSVTSGSNALDFVTAAGTSPAAYTGGGLNAPVSVAIDGLGYVWVVNSGNETVSAFSNAGTAQSGSAGYGAASIQTGATAVSIDNTGGVWVTSGTGSNSRLTHIFGAAAPVVAPLATGVTNGTTGARP